MQAIRPYTSDGGVPHLSSQSPRQEGPAWLGQPSERALQQRAAKQGGRLPQHAVRWEAVSQHSSLSSSSSSSSSSPFLPPLLFFFFFLVFPSSFWVRARGVLFHSRSSKTALVKVAFQGHTRSRRISCQHRECNCRASPNNVCVSQTVGWINHSIWKWNKTIAKGTLIRYRLLNLEPKWIRTILDIYINELHIFLPFYSSDMIWNTSISCHILHSSSSECPSSKQPRQCHEARRGRYQGSAMLFEIQDNQQRRVKVKTLYK